MADERHRGWRAGLARATRLARRLRPRREPDDQVLVQPLMAVGWMLATLIAVIGVTAGVWWWLHGVTDQAKPGTDRAQAQLSAARIALTAGGGAGAGVGLMLAFRRQQHQEKATVLADRDAVERRINDRYTAAIDQLGSDKLDVRLGGIYALERIAADSRRDHPTVIDVLCTFVREHTRPGALEDVDPVLAGWMATDNPPERGESPLSPPAADVQAALTVIGRATGYGTRVPDLHGANLSGANLGDANLSRADLRDAHLAGANLHYANLRDANLFRADLRDAHLPGANLHGAILHAANLHGADLRDAHLPGATLPSANLDRANLDRADLRDAHLGAANLQGATLMGANLDGAHLPGANLHGAHLIDANLHWANLDGARHDSGTQWSEGFTPPPSA